MRSTLAALVPTDRAANGLLETTVQREQAFRGSATLACSAAPRWILARHQTTRRADPDKPPGTVRYGACSPFLQMRVSDFLVESLIAEGIEDAIETGELSSGKLLVLGGFAHAGDYSAAAVIRWQVSGSVTA
jgi:hypothetical protein